MFLIDRAKAFLRSSEAEAETHGVQYGGIPYRIVEGEVVFLMITSRRSANWVFPKGNVEGNQSPHETVAQEAFEEAGVIGEVGEAPIGSYVHARNDKSESLVRVELYPLHGHRATRGVARGTAAFSPLGSAATGQAADGEPGRPHVSLPSSTAGCALAAEADLARQHPHQQVQKSGDDRRGGQGDDPRRCDGQRVLAPHQPAFVAALELGNGLLGGAVELIAARPRARSP